MIVYRKLQFPLRFKTVEDYHAFYAGDKSKSITPFEQKDYGNPVGKKVVMRQEYRDAQFEVGVVSIG